MSNDGNDTPGPARLDIPALLNDLTIEEKISLLDGEDAWRTTPIERLGVPAILVSDGPHGLRVVRPDGPEVGGANSYPATCFPPAVGLASSWSQDLLKRVGVALGQESRTLGVGVLLGPGINIKRSPLCGRNFEYFSEDPFLTGTLASSMVQGVQSQGVGTSLKHFAANNQEHERMSISAEIDERALREIYLAGFERVVKEARPWTLMCAYNRINGVYASEDPWLLTDVLRDQWGFDGLVVSDWGAINKREEGLKAGLDLEMPTSHGLGAKRIQDALESGDLTMEVFDQGVGRVLHLIDQVQAGLALTLDGQPIPEADLDANHELAHEAAAASAVLLKNENNILPIDPSDSGSVAVIGPFADKPRFQGAGSSRVNPTRTESGLDSLRAALDGQREVAFAAGFEKNDDIENQALLDEALAVAADAAVVVLFLGLPGSWESEGYDRDSMDLPGNQLTLLEAVVGVNPNTVVVLSNGSVVSLSGWEHQPKAILEGWLLGQAGGAAIADLLLGVANPAGRLVETIPLRLEHNPSHGNFPGESGKVVYGEGILVGYRWYDTRHLPVSYPFGHGLSYTSFSYDNLAVSVTGDAGPDGDQLVIVDVTVTNTGAVAGTETVQVYVSDPECSVQRPSQELGGFGQVSLEAGETQTVRVILDRRAFAFWHLEQSDWVVEGGTFEIRAGSSSRDIHQSQTIELEGDGVRPLLLASSPADVWFDDPEAGPWLHEQVDGGRMGRILNDPRIGPMFRAAPIERLARNPAFGLDEAGVLAAVERFAKDSSD